jgi:hypothetical protein
MRFGDESELFGKALLFNDLDMYQIAELIYGKTGIQCIIHAVHIDISCIILDSQIVISVDCFLEIL